MEWLDSIGWQARRWCFNLVDEQGVPRSCDVAEIASWKMAGDGKSFRKSATLNLQTAQIVSAQEYVAGLGFSSPVSEGHQVYSFQIAKRRYLIPAFVLYRAFFRPFKGLLPLLLQPQGLEQFCVPDLSSDIPSVNVFQGMWPGGTHCRPSMLAALSWTSCFPSANQMWHSVLMNAWNGALGLALPIGRAKLVLRGEVIGEDVFVTEVCLVGLETDEVPYAFAESHSRSISFHDALQGAEAWCGRPPKSDASLAHRRGRVLSDEEWEAIRPIVEGKRPTRRLNLRYVVDGVIEKLASGVAWKDVQYKSGNCVNANQYYQQWLQDGVWSLVKGIILV